MKKAFNSSRRTLLGSAAVGAVSQLGLTSALSIAATPRSRGVAPNVGTFKTIAAGELEIAYAEYGPGLRR